MAKTRELAAWATGPLQGVRIVDMTSVVFGAYATQMLGDLGADVIKVEFPAGFLGQGGDIMRWAGDGQPGGPEGLGPIFMNVNRNKRSIMLDLRKDSAARALRRLIGSAAAFVTSVRYEGMKRLGLDYESVRRIKPDIVYVHGSGYGADGPYAGEPAYDDLVQSACGLADLLPRATGGSAPQLIPALIADKVSGHFMAQAILAALFHQQRSGEGQFVEVPMFECLTSFTLTEHLFGHVYDPPTGPLGYPRLTNPNRKPFPTKDGFIGLMPYTDAQWVNFFEAAGLGEAIKTDPRFSTYGARVTNISALYKLIEEVTPTRTTQEWIDLLRPHQIPVVRTNRLNDLPNDPHLNAVGLFEHYEHPQAGSYVAMRSPLKFSVTPPAIVRHPPLLGEHTTALLNELSSDESSHNDETSVNSAKMAQRHP